MVSLDGSPRIYQSTQRIAAQLIVNTKGLVAAAILN